jgi:hypothetical protein
MKSLTTHLLAGLLAWWLVTKWTHPPHQTPVAPVPEPAAVRESPRPPPTPTPRQAFLNAWREQVAAPVGTSADLMEKQRHLGALFTEWMQIDPLAALVHLDEVVLPGTHNLIRNALTVANPADAELIFREVDQIESVPYCHYRGGMEELAQRVAARDPQRAVALALSRPAGTDRGNLVATMLTGHEAAAFQQLPRLITAESAFFRSPKEAGIIRKKIAEEQRRFPAEP